MSQVCSAFPSSLSLNTENTKQIAHLWHTNTSSTTDGYSHLQTLWKGVQVLSVAAMPYDQKPSRDPKDFTAIRITFTTPNHHSTTNPKIRTGFFDSKPDNWRQWYDPYYFPMDGAKNLKPFVWKSGFVGIDLGEALHVLSMAGFETTASEVKVLMVKTSKLPWRNRELCYLFYLSGGLEVYVSTVTKIAWRRNCDPGGNGKGCRRRLGRFGQICFFGSLEVKC